jgi:hypothetical protein
MGACAESDFGGWAGRQHSLAAQKLGNGEVLPARAIADDPGFVGADFEGKCSHGITVIPRRGLSREGWCTKDAERHKRARGAAGIADEGDLGERVAAKKRKKGGKRGDRLSVAG